MYFLHLISKHKRYDKYYKGMQWLINSNLDEVKAWEYSNVIKGGVILNFFVAFSTAHIFWNIKNVGCCSRSEKTKAIVNSGQLNVGD